MTGIGFIANVKLHFFIYVDYVRLLPSTPWYIYGPAHSLAVDLRVAHVIFKPFDVI